MEGSGTEAGLSSADLVPTTLPGHGVCEPAKPQSAPGSTAHGAEHRADEFFWKMYSIYMLAFAKG